ncbi:MAG: immune inhibitor A, partial [Clostridiales bacterium]|nr:immune inhibitor A [Clostridiales bacterium]
MRKRPSFRLSRQLLIIIVMLLAFSSVISAAPLKDVPVTVIQPDGAVLKCLASGDEFFNYLHDASGNIIIQHPVTGYYTYARLDNGGKIIASWQIALDSGNYYDLDAAIYSPAFAKGRGLKLGDIDFSLNQDLLDRQDLPKETPHPAPFGARSQEPAPKASPDIGIKGKTVAGSMENIIVLLCFADEDPIITPDIRNKIEDIFNGPILSLKHYMKAVSENVFELNSTLVGLDGNTLLMYQDSHPRCYYQPYNEVTNPLGYTDNQYIEREQTLLGNAVKAIDGSSILEGKDLDIDGNGQIDSITFIASGNVDGWADLLWPHKWILYTETVNLNGKQVMSYSFQLLDYLFPPAGDPRLNAICHESLHTFGLPDLYRYNYDGEPVGLWDIMASNIPQTQFPNSHLRLRYAGWGQELVKITKNDRYTLSPIGSTDGVTAYAIQSSSPNQFILLEYRSEENPSGYDTLYDTSSSYHKGLTIARINTNFMGNANQIGATDDEVYIYRPGETIFNQGEGGIESASL